MIKNLDNRKKYKETSESLKKIVQNLTDPNDLKVLDVSEVKDMSELFVDKHYSVDISGWDVSNVTNMECMFLNSDFDEDLSRWDVHNVKNYDYCFWSSPLENQPNKQPKFPK